MKKKKNIPAICWVPLTRPAMIYVSVAIMAEE